MSATFKKWTGITGIVLGILCLLWYFSDFLFFLDPGQKMAFPGYTGWEVFLRSSLKLIFFLVLTLVGYKLLLAGRHENPPLFEQVRDETKNCPEEPIPLDGFSLQGSSEDDIHYVPGAMDAIFGSAGGGRSELKSVQEAVEMINNGELTSWDQLENRLESVSAIDCIPILYNRLDEIKITPLARNLFWQAALNSRQPEVIKLGIELGTFDLNEQKAKKLEIFARHPEFTVYVAHVLLREGETEGEYRDRLKNLIGVTREWGAVRLIEILLNEEEIVLDRQDQKNIILSAANHIDRALKEVAFQIADQLPLDEYFTEAESDDELFQAIVILMESLMIEPEPIGELTKLDEGWDLLQKYVTLLQKRDPNVELLYGLDTVTDFLRNHAKSWPGRDQLLKEVREFRQSIFSVDLVRAGLQDESTRRISLSLVDHQNMSELLPEVEECYLESPDRMCVKILGELGGKEQLKLLLNSIPDLASIDVRKHKKRMVDVPTGSELTRDLLYASVIRHMGKLGTVEAIEALKQAARDYHPRVRASAAIGFGDLKPDSWDEEIVSLVKENMELIEGEERVKVLLTGEKHESSILLEKTGEEGKREHPCPGCGFEVFTREPGSGERCPICSWIDDRQQLMDPGSHSGRNSEPLKVHQRHILSVIPREADSLQGFMRNPDWHPLPGLDGYRPSPEKNNKADNQETSPEEPLYYWL